MADLAPAFPWAPSGDGAETRKSLLVRQLVLAFVAMRRQGMLGLDATLVLEGTAAGVEKRVTLELGESGVLTVNGIPFLWDTEEQLFAALNELFLLRAIERAG